MVEHSKPDITHKKPPSDTGLLSAQQYERILEATGYAVFTTDANGYFVNVSDFAQKLTGYTPQMLCQMTCFDLVPEAYRAQVRAMYLREMAGNLYETTLEFPILAADGQLKRLEISGVVIEQDGAKSFQGIAHDVTSRAQTEQALAAERSLLRTLLDSATDTIYFKDRNSRFVRINRAQADVLGIQDPDDAVGKTDADFQDPALSQLFYEEEQELLNTGKPLLDRIEYNPLPDGTPRWFSATKVPVWNEAGEIVGLVGISRDITERKLAEDALKKSNEIYRTLARSLPNSAVIVFDHDLRYLIAEGEALEHSGFAKSGVEGKTLWEVLPQPAAEELLPFYQAALRGEKQILERQRDGRIYQVFFVPIYDENQQIAAGMIVSQDITNLKQAESALNKRIEELTALRRVDVELADKLNINYVLNMALDAALRLSHADGGFIALLENQQMRLAKAVGPYAQQTIDETLNQNRGILARVLRQQKAELIHDIPNDPDYTVSLPGIKAKIVIPLLSQERMIGVMNLETSAPERFTEETFQFAQILATRIAVAVDNARLYRETEQQLDELRTLYDRVSKLEQLKTDMIRIASHDLRNPLSTIDGFLELAQGVVRERGDTTLDDYLGYISRASKRMFKIVSDILSLERIRETAESMAVDMFDLRELVEKTVHELQPQANLKKQILTQQLSPHPQNITGDSAQIREAVANLITNAIKYTPGDTGQINITLKAENGLVIFEVSDNGPGVPDDQQDKLFQPFFRVRTKETRHVEGTGLGLHLVKNIIERHGGVMRFHSVYGQGSTFGFSLFDANSQ